MKNGDAPEDSGEAGGVTDEGPDEGRTRCLLRSEDEG